MCTSAGGTRRKSLRLFLMSLRHRWMAGESISTILFSPSIPLLERASPCSLGRVFVVGRAPKRVSLRIIRIRVHTRSPTATQKIKSREICASSIPLERLCLSPQKKQTSTQKPPTMILLPLLLLLLPRRSPFQTKVSSDNKHLYKRCGGFCVSFCIVFFPLFVLGF